MVQRTGSTFSWPEWTVEFPGELSREKDTRRRKKSQEVACILFNLGSGERKVFITLLFLGFLRFIP